MAPDVTIYGKAVGGGFPVGAIGGSAEGMDVLDSSNEETFLLNQHAPNAGFFAQLCATRSLACWPC